MRTQYGFIAGPLEVRRLFGDDKNGQWIAVLGKQQEVVIRVTKGGRLRVGKPNKRTFP